MIFLVFSAGSVSGETDTLSDPGWVHIFFEEFNDNVGGYSVQQTSDGGYVITGYYKSWPESFVNESDYEDQVVEGACLIKTYSNGTLQWFRVFDADYDTFPNVARSVQQTSDGGYIIVGSYVDDSLDVWLIKTDAQGTKEWDQTFGGSGKQVGYDVKQTSDGGYIVTGTTSYGQNIYLLKTDTDGNEEWENIFGGAKFASGRSVLQTSDGGYILTGDNWVVKTDPEGNEEWNTTSFGGRSICQASDGGYVIAVDSYDVEIIKIDHAGNEEWIRTFDDFGSGGCNDVQGTFDGGYILTGSYYAGQDRIDAYLIKTDAQGNKEWDRSFGDVGEDRGFSVQQTSEGGYVLTGRTYSYGEDAFLIKTDQYGNTGEDRMAPTPRIVSRTMDVVSFFGFMVMFLVHLLALPLLVFLVLVYLWRRCR